MIPNPPCSIILPCPLHHQALWVHLYCHCLTRALITVGLNYCLCPPPHWLVKSITTHHHIAHFCLHFHHGIHLSECNCGIFFPKGMSLPGLRPYIFQNTIQTPWFMTHGLWPGPAYICSFLFQYLPSTHTLFIPPIEQCVACVISPAGLHLHYFTWANIPLLECLSSHGRKGKNNFLHPSNFSGWGLSNKR